MSKTPLLELKNIGKIYVSEGNVAVGIRGVNLAFNRGEFVAVTGASGSGKSTLLNVISGMDSYEEGELLIDGEPTSHYLQKDWEAYREEYISFIFQDYNIIESFTVLQNVELALMHIENPAKRRKKAMELLRRVGLEKHLHHRGSKLSGGQKQRTVIARALAKDSPIILADEPTGNLDSKTSAEIIELLREVSREKLVIVVTHNFDQVEACATRHIRIFDGAVELDHTLRASAPVASAPAALTRPAEALPPPPVYRKKIKALKNGLTLGRVRFTAMPKLSIFLCLLMTVTALILTFMSALSYDATGLFDRSTMFTHMNGRAVIVRRDGAIITDKELETLAADVGAQDAMHYDFMLDRTVQVRFDRVNKQGNIDNIWYNFSFGYPAEDVTLSAGRYPSADNEVILEVPISAKPYLSDPFTETELPLLFDMAPYRVVGVRYYYDNTVTPRLLFTESGYKLASAMAFFSEQINSFSYDVSATDILTGEEHNYYVNAYTYIDVGMPDGQYYLNIQELRSLYDFCGPENVKVSAALQGKFQSNYTNDYDDFYYDDGYYNGYDASDANVVRYPLDEKPGATTVSNAMKSVLEKQFYETWNNGISNADFVVLSPSVFMDFMYEHYYAKSYTQASLFFENDREAHDKVEDLRDRGYIAVVSDETIELDVMTLISKKLGQFMSAFGWIVSVVFATLFLSLCSSRAMNATRGDIGIMRSMGIPTGVVRVSIYVQTLIALIPAFLVTAAACVAVYLIPKTNYIFTFLHIGDYLILAVVLIAIAFNLSHKQVAKMFNESVKKTLKKGGTKA